MQELLKDRARGEKAYELWRTKRVRTAKVDLAETDQNVPRVAKRLYEKDVGERGERQKIYKDMKEEMENQEVEGYIQLQENRLA